MTALVIGGAVASLAVGCWWGSKSIPAKRKGPDLHILQERIMHAKNVTMRMEELLHKEQKLADEQESYSALVSLKEETEWLLSLVEAQVLKGNSSDLEDIESLLDATGKTLRLVLDIGQRSTLRWTTLMPSLHHIHKTLCLVSKTPTPHNHILDSKSVDFHVNGTMLVQLLIQEYRMGNVGSSWPFATRNQTLHFMPLNGPARSILHYQRRSVSSPPPLSG